MHRIIASRGMGRTTKLLCKASELADKGEYVVFIVLNTYIAKNLKELKEFNPKICFTTLKKFLEGGYPKDAKIFIDDLDWCVGSVIGNDYTYSIAIDDYEGVY